VGGDSHGLLAIAKNDFGKISKTCQVSQPSARGSNRAPPKYKTVNTDLSCTVSTQISYLTTHFTVRSSLSNEIAGHLFNMWVKSIVRDLFCWSDMPRVFESGQRILLKCYVSWRWLSSGL
jgi:hypothetical protein